MITCASSSFAFTDWPEFAPLGSDAYASGTCQAGFVATNSALPPQRLCYASGAYGSTLVNPCIRTTGPTCPNHCPCS